MDNKNEVRQHLLDKRDNLKKTILEKLKELYLLRNNSLVCGSPNLAAKEKNISLFSNIRDEDLFNEHKFSQLLNLKSDEPATQQQLLSNRDVETSSAQDEVPMELDTPSSWADQFAEENGKQAVETAKVSHRKIDQLNSNKTATTTGSSATTEVVTVESKEDDQVDVIPTKIARLEAPTDLHKHAESTPITDHKTNDQTDREQHIDTIVSHRSPLQQNATPTTTNTTTSTTITTIPTATTITNSIPSTNLSRFSEMQQKPKHRDETDHQDREYRMEIDDKRSSRLDQSRVESPKEPIISLGSHEITVSNAENHQKQIFERAKHEAAVTARIAELRKQGLWSAKRLPKLQEPPRPKTHWDYLLEEMRWLSSDFDAERKWKRKAAKKCALMVYRYHQEKRSKQERAEREHLQHIKKVAAAQAKEIRSFWSSIEKIVDFRQQTKLEETRKKAWGLHLNYILDQTSKISNTCLEDNNKTQQSTKEEALGIEYSMSQDGENVEKEPVIKVSFDAQSTTIPAHGVLCF